MKVQLKYIGTNQPQNMIIESEKEDVKRLLNSGNYEEISNVGYKEIADAKEVEVKSEEKPEIEKPNKSWTEMEIYNWIVDNNIPIEYKPVNDTKREALERLKKGGYI